MKTKLSTLCLSLAHIGSTHTFRTMNAISFIVFARSSESASACTASNERTVMKSGALMAAIERTACLAKLRRLTSAGRVDVEVARWKIERSTRTASKLFWKTAKPRMQSSRLTFWLAGLSVSSRDLPI